MLVSSTLWVLILAVLPIIMYSYLVYYLVPENLISKQRARRYLITGLLSPSLISLFYFMFPELGTQQSENLLAAYLIFTIIQVGFLEEFTKYITFWWVSKERVTEKSDLPIAVMFYSMMSAVGFAITENIYYLISTQKKIEAMQEFMPGGIDASSILTNLAWSRSIKSVIIHMICGVIMGYFLAKAHKIFYNSKIKEEAKKANFRKYKMVFKGIFFAALFHGIYDLNLMLPDNIYHDLFTIIILSFGLVIGHFIIKDLIHESQSIKVQSEKLEQNETDKSSS